MGGDHKPGSDLDIAIVVGPWSCRTDGIPCDLGGARIGWVLVDRSPFDPPPKVMGIPWVLIRRGVWRWGEALPEHDLGEEEAGMDVKNVLHDMRHAVVDLGTAIHEVAYAQGTSGFDRKQGY